VDGDGEQLNGARDEGPVSTAVIPVCVCVCVCVCACVFVCGEAFILLAHSWSP
jgi:hypothetical protein